MTITLPLDPQKEAQLNALANGKGLTPGELLKQTIDQLIADSPDSITSMEPAQSLRGLLAKYGPAPSAEEIDRNRAEIFANFPRTGI